MSHVTLSHATLVIVIAAAALAPAIMDVFAAVRCALMPCSCRRNVRR